MSDKTTEAMMLALEALEHHDGNLPWNAFVEVRKDLREALAQQQKPLTDEEIIDAVRDAGFDWMYGWSLDETQGNRFVTLVRIVEAAHGIKEPSNA